VTYRYAIGLGSNRSHGRYGRPRAVIAAALKLLRPIAVSHIIETAPIGPSSRRFANAAALVESGLAPPDLLALLKRIGWKFVNDRGQQFDRVRMIVKNDLPESTAVHFHGCEIPNDQDGVPFITQPPIKSGQSYTYEFTAPNPGSHMYHSHHNSAKQVGLGLLGAFIIEPKDTSKEPKVDVDYVFILNDGAHGYTFNGKSFPATEPIVAKLGQKVRIRYMNEGMMIHPMHLHGMHQTVISKDGWPLPAPYRCDTLNIAPGERYDVIVNCNNPGTWAFHCHILPHAESDHGMFGMVTALVVQK